MKFSKRPRPMDFGIPQQEPAEAPAIDVQESDWECRVEPDGQVRLGLMYVNGLRAETGRVRVEFRRLESQLDPEPLTNKVKHGLEPRHVTRPGPPEPRHGRQTVTRGLSETL